MKRLTVTMTDKCVETHYGGRLLRRIIMTPELRKLFKLFVQVLVKDRVC